MATQAGRGDVVAHLNLKGGMGIHMTGHAVLQLEMIPVFIVATVTGRNNINICRWMSLVALSTESLVGLTFDSDCEDNILMTFTAVVYIDCGLIILFVLFCLC